ncbi:phosphohistidine phosphatase SixA [Gloeocapsopsis sp. IPPAS B-1203]|uniref:phosphohistidine phosphatase SixA n=1 Tax=Gloeocapsopsis sp. IPPAS B-1203 TaxID=2049454 RepID=UPI000C19C2A6|nr:phosphohistidine phosphatase SixA [Gloeocapsopsis sp. IPPAS B-1203]PIG92794.1 phosphohistidine phosphatase SixA [Gloeocapsopsis sp. IPPAS B-1203]
MELYLIRHGIAQEREIGLADEERSLTDKGHNKTRQVAQRLYDLGIRFDVLLTSPLVRSQQTAKILHDCKLSRNISESAHLAPNGSIYDWLDWFKEQQYSQQTQLALVGHQPNLGQWAEILVWGEDRAKLVLKKAGIIGIALPEADSPIGQSQLFWLTAPKFLL